MKRPSLSPIPPPIWECAVCIAQFFGGPRCTAHNPTPEERLDRECRVIFKPVFDALEALPADLQAEGARRVIERIQGDVSRETTEEEVAF